jgi:hypothetical protein
MDLSSSGHIIVMFLIVPNSIIPYSREDSGPKISTSSPEIGYCNDLGEFKDNKSYENANIGVAISKVISVFVNTTQIAYSVSIFSLLLFTDATYI